MSEKKIYMLIYDRDDGSSESWSLFYTSMEFFETDELRAERIAYLRTRDPELEFDQRDMSFTQDPREFYAKYYDEDEDEDDPAPAEAVTDRERDFLDLVEKAASSEATDIHVTVRAEDE
jgi:hypothetical protein